MNDKQKIDYIEACRILALEEDSYCDVKHVTISPAKLSCSISAFANTSGGELFIGVGEEDGGGNKARTWYGFANIEAANPIFQVLERMKPIGGHYKATFLECDKHIGYVLQLTIFKSKEIISSTQGIPYVRRKAQNLQVTDPEGLKRLELDKGIVSFEDSTLNVPLSDITTSNVLLGYLENVVPSAKPEPWLSKQNLIDRGMPTVAGIMLFSDEPQAALPKRSAIKIYRYKTKNEDGSRDTLAFDPITVEGCVYNQIRDAVTKTKEIIEGISKLGENGLERVQYPHETLHEIITNAVLHRDYSIPSDTHVRIYENRVEVESPGRLPGHITKENILREQSARNPKIIRLIHKFPNPPNKDVGEGLNTAFEAMKKLKLKEPVVEEGDNSVIIYIKHEPLSSAHQVIMGYLEKHSEITNKVARDLTGIGSENSIKSIFMSLNKRKMLERVPGKKGKSAAWRKFTGYYEDKTPKSFFDVWEN